MELQAINAEARVSLRCRPQDARALHVRARVGQEAEQAQNLFAIVAENATESGCWRPRAATRGGGGRLGGGPTRKDAIGREMRERVTSRRSSSTTTRSSSSAPSRLYVNLHGRRSRSMESVFEVEDGEMAEAAIELRPWLWSVGTRA